MELEVNVRKNRMDNPEKHKMKTKTKKTTKTED